MIADMSFAESAELFLVTKSLETITPFCTGTLSLFNRLRLN